MLLAFLVYAVSNLTYNGTFFFWIGVLPVLLWSNSYLVNLFYITKTNYITRIVKDNKYKLVKDLDIFKAGEEILVEEIYKYSDTIHISSASYDGGNRKYISCGASELKDAISAIEIQTKNLKINLKKTWLVVGFVFMMLHTLLPNRQTAIYVAGAWMVQTILTDEKTQEIGAAAYEATLNQLRTWSKESKDLEQLLNSVKKEITK